MPKSKALPFKLDPLNKRFVPPKPKNSVEDARVLKIEKLGKAIYTRKRDGHFVSAVITDRARIYTRGKVEDISGNFPHLIDELSKIPFPKGGTLLCCELIMEKEGKDWREFVSSLAGSKPEVAVSLQKEHGYAKLMVFNVLVAGGKDVSRRSNSERLSLIQTYLSKKLKHIIPVEVLSCSFAEAQKRVLREKWEGIVVYDADRPTAYRLDGNENRPPRPEGCWKRKPSYEDDFIAYSWESGTKGKRHEKRMGKLFLSQVHPKTGVEIPCGEVGIGFNDEEREFFADDSLYPCVVQVEYERRFLPRKISGGRLQCALCNPRFVRLRNDKKTGGCLLPQELAKELAQTKKGNKTGE